MATELNILREKLQAAKAYEKRMGLLYRIAVASVKSLEEMIVEYEEHEEAPAPAPAIKGLLRFSCDQNPKYDQSVDIAAYKTARTNIQLGTTGLKGDLPYGISFPLRTTLKAGGLGEITKQSFEMRVGNYESVLKGGGGLHGNGVVAKIKVIKFLCELNPTNEQLEEAFTYYSTREARE